MADDFEIVELVWDSNEGHYRAKIKTNGSVGDYTIRTNCLMSLTAGGPSIVDRTTLMPPQEKEDLRLEVRGVRSVSRFRERGIENGLRIYALGKTDDLKTIDN